MFNIRTMNKISPLGIELLEKKGCAVGAGLKGSEALMLRSAELGPSELWPELLCIGRVGAGTNNIPVEECTKKGIVVFNAPGANAEAVKELEMCQLVLSSRDVIGGIDWVHSLAGKGDEIPAIVEKGKSAFAGPELMGKTLGVIGLGATGALVANSASGLGMEVIGYDPYMSVDAAWGLSREVSRAESLDDIFRSSDYISINIPYNDETRHMIDADAIGRMKTGVRILNESRAEVVDDDAMLAGIDSGKVGRYVTDFPNEKLIGVPNVICMPHLGACTPESEAKCAVMAAGEIYDYLKNGNIKNSVNFPNAALDRLGVCRVCVLHKNVPNMINSFLDIIGTEEINIEHMINKARGEYACTIMDLGSPLPEDAESRILESGQVLRVRVL